jgi:hypothetical protein
MAATKISAMFTAPMRFKNKYRLNEEVLLLLCPPYIPEMYISVLNKLMLSIALKLSSNPKIVLISVGVGVSKVSLDMENSNIVTPKYS